MVEAISCLFDLPLILVWIFWRRRLGTRDLGTRDLGTRDLGNTPPPW
jgi:hypothetical protein